MFAGVTFLQIAAGISAASSLAGMYETTLAEQAAMEQIQIQEKEKQIQLTQKKTSIYSETQKVLQRQIAQSTTRGIGLDSPSFNAIQRDTINVGAKNSQNANLESEFAKYNAAAERENVRISTHAKLFGDAAQLGMSFAMLQGQQPKCPGEE